MKKQDDWINLNSQTVIFDGQVTVAADETLPTGQLLKTTDGGKTWSKIGAVTETPHGVLVREISETSTAPVLICGKVRESELTPAITAGLRQNLFLNKIYTY